MSCNTAIVILWPEEPGNVTLTVTNGKADRSDLRLNGTGPARAEVAVADARLQPGPGATVVRVASRFGVFSCFLRDVLAAGPVYVPDGRAIVARAGECRSFAELAAALTAGKALDLQRLEELPETTYAGAAALGRVMHLPAVLGLGRDCRLFQLDVDRASGYWGWIRPSFGGYPVFPHYPHEPDDARYEYAYVLGRGMGCQVDMRRRLEDGCLPILHGTAVDGEITYEVTAFVTLECDLLQKAPPRGTPALFAARLAWVNLSPEETDRFEAARAAGAPDELDAGNQAVLRFRAVATNAAGVPRYAFFKSPELVTMRQWQPAIPQRYDPESGCLLVGECEEAAVVTRLDGAPMPLGELSLLLPPGGSVVFEMTVPHAPVSRDRAQAMAAEEFAGRLEDARAFWKVKSVTMPEVRLPERHIEERMKAGLFQLYTLAYGREGEAALSVPAGLYYPPIGSESLPSIFFYDAMGWHEEARRGLQFFLDRQREDGFIQVYAHYMIETSAVLFGLAEHYRHTRDDGWVCGIEDKLLKSCDYIVAWRQRNRREELRGRGYGMLEGAVADEKDPTPYFVNNGYACAGLRGAAEMLAAVNPARARALAAEAEAFRQDIRDELAAAMAASPVVPLADGSWRPAAPPWAGHPGPLILFADSRPAFTHGAFTTQDSVVGPNWLIYQGILDPGEPLAEAILQTHHELMTARNVAFCQQYYSRHDYAHLLRGEVPAFLADFYHSLGLADPELYHFWEHFSMNEQGPFKTHEQAWFLMQCRWMLYLERGQTLHLLPGIPRAWLDDGQEIVIDGMRSHFGPIALHVESRLAEGMIAVKIACASAHRPKRVEIRLPHPEGRPAVRVDGGQYDAGRECVVIDDFVGEAEVRAWY